MSARDLPDVHGHFDAFGGRFVPEALQAALNQLEKTFEAALADPDFDAELDALRRDYAGRPSPLTEAPGSPSTWPSRPAARCGSCSSVRTSTTPARTRSTTCWGKRC